MGKVRKSLREVLNVSDEAIALVNGQQVADDCRLLDGDNLEFVRVEGQKGLGELLSPQDLIGRWRISEAQYRELLGQGLPAIRFADGATLHPEVAVDDWMRLRSAPGPDDSSFHADVRRIADHFDPPPSDKVGSEYVAKRLGCTTTWVAEQVRSGQIPERCLVLGTGNGKPWKFHRRLIDEWIAAR